MIYEIHPFYVHQTVPTLFTKCESLVEHITRFYVKTYLLTIAKHPRMSRGHSDIVKPDFGRYLRLKSIMESNFTVSSPYQQKDPPYTSCDAAQAFV